MSLATHPRIAPEIQAIREVFEPFGPVEVREENGEHFITFVSPAYGWTPATGVRMLVKIPPLYPEQRPDLLFVHASARNKSDQVPNRMAEVGLVNERWSQISWHLTGAYDPTDQNLLGFARTAMLYLQRAP